MAEPTIPSPRSSQGVDGYSRSKASVPATTGTAASRPNVLISALRKHLGDEVPGYIFYFEEIQSDSLRANAKQMLENHFACHLADTYGGASQQESSFAHIRVCGRCTTILRTSPCGFHWKQSTAGHLALTCS